MNLLEDFLVWRNRRKVWRLLMARSNLFRELSEVVEDGALDKLRRIENECDFIEQKSQEEVLDQWYTFRSLLWCTQEAVTRPESYRDRENDRFLFDKMNLIQRNHN